MPVNSVELFGFSRVTVGMWHNVRVLTDRHDSLDGEVPAVAVLVARRGRMVLLLVL